MTGDSERRILQLERKVWHLGAVGDQAERRLTGFEQRLWQRYGQFAASGSPPTSWTYVLTCYGVNSRVVFGQDVEIQDGLGNVLDSGTTDGGGVVTLHVPSTYGGTGLYLVPGLSGTHQRFDPSLLGTYALIDGGDTTSITFTAATNYHTIDNCAWPLYYLLSVDDPGVTITHTVTWSSGQQWDDGGSGGSISYGGCGSPACPSRTVTVSYYLFLNTGGSGGWNGEADYARTAGLCPDDSGAFSGSARADMTLYEAATPIITMLARGSSVLYCSGTPTWTITEL